MNEQVPHYQIFAIKYADREARRSEHFVGGDPHDGPMPMDYFTWVVVGAGRVLLVDTGFTAEVAARRKRNFLRCPIESLEYLDLAPEAITDVIVTHMHYDHAGNYHKLPNARFHLQEKELAFVTGRNMRYPFFARSYELDNVLGMVRLNFDQKLELHDGDVELGPGLSLHLAPGHTAGLQVVRVHTQRGEVVLASDASHYYENMESSRPFTTVLSTADAIAAFRTVERLASSPRHIIPGHDPLVMSRYAAPSSALRGIVARLDVDPVM
jgi:glyoxylase-like metal-dependent hydrolase (beta-lactamase superfamily II)